MIDCLVPFSQVQQGDNAPQKNKFTLKSGAQLVYIRTLGWRKLFLYVV